MVRYRFNLLTLDFPDPDKLLSAVQKGIWDCLKLYTEAPPKGSKSNFGFAAYRRWADLLTKSKQRLSWAKEFPPGDKMYAGLTSAFHHIAIFGKEGTAERNLYADFLDEASILLDKVVLKDVAKMFRLSGQAWDALGLALLPDHVPPFKETRELMLRKHKLFREKGNAALADIQEIKAQLGKLKEEVAADFPLNEKEVTAFCENLRTHILEIHDIEQEAITVLQETMA